MSAQLTLVENRAVVVVTIAVCLPFIRFSYVIGTGHVSYINKFLDSEFYLC